MGNRYEEYLQFGLETAKAAGSTIQHYFKNSTADYKVDGSEVTIADREAEHTVRNRILDKYPNHDILGEEFGKGGRLGSTYTWIIDPLDGTTWFTIGVPIFGTLVSLLEDGEPVMGIIHFPMFSETVYAARGAGCWLQRDDKKPARVNVDQTKGLRLSKAIISASGVHKSDISPMQDKKNINLTGLIKKAGKFRFCGDCLQHALVAQGRIHAAVDAIMQPWDIAALIPCIEEAGGVATTREGERSNIVFGGSLVTSCNMELHTEILEMLNSYRHTRDSD